MSWRGEYLTGAVSIGFGVAHIITGTPALYMVAYLSGILTLGMVIRKQAKA